MNTVTLSVSIDDEGRIQCAGPFQDKMLCYGLLGHLGEAIKNFQAPPSILPASPEDVAAVNGSRPRLER